MMDEAGIGMLYYTPLDWGLRVAQHEDVATSVVAIVQYWMQHCDKMTAQAWRRDDRVGVWGRLGRGQQARQFDGLAAPLHQALKDAKEALLEPPDPNNETGSVFPPIIQTCVKTAQRLVDAAAGPQEIDDVMVLRQSTFVSAGAPGTLGIWSASGSVITWAEEELFTLLLRRLHRSSELEDVERSKELVIHALSRMSGENEKEDPKLNKKVSDRPRARELSSNSPGENSFRSVGPSDRDDGGVRAARDRLR